MSTDESPQRRALATHLRRVYSADPRPLDGDEPCQWCGACDEPAAFAIPARSGGDLGVCRRHLAARRHRDPDLWSAIVDVDERARFVADDMGRFVGWHGDLPPTRQIHDDVVERVALTDTGLGVYQDPPSDDEPGLRFLLVTRDDVVASTSVEPTERDVCRVIDSLRREHGLAVVGGPWSELYREHFAYPCDPTEIAANGGDGR